MKLIPAGIALIKRYEGCRLTAYPDPATGGDPWTIGYGCTGPEIKEGVVWTQNEADQNLLSRLNTLSDKLQDLITVELTDNQFNAIVSLVYNIGIGNFEKSTMLRLINLGAMTKAADQFLVWSKAGGKEMSGLLARRQAEKRMFN